MLFLGKKQPGWLQRLFTHDTVKETPGIFTEGHSADEMARNLKIHAPDYQAAMAKLTWFINTMGERLSAKHRGELEKAKHVLRTIYKRDDRIELYEKPMLREKKKEKKVAMMHLVFQDNEGHVHHGDMFVELLGKTPEELEHLKTTSLYHRHMIEQLSVYEKFLKMYFKVNDISKIKEMMMSRYRQKQEVPYWNLDIDKPESAKVASAEGELVFASESDALQTLADLTGQKIMVADDEGDMSDQQYVDVLYEEYVDQDWDSLEDVLGTVFTSILKKQVKSPSKWSDMSPEERYQALDKAFINYIKYFRGSPAGILRGAASSMSDQQYTSVLSDEYVGQDWSSLEEALGTFFTDALKEHVSSSKWDKMSEEERYHVLDKAFTDYVRKFRGSSRSSGNELLFSSEAEALQRLADLTGQQVVVADKKN